MAQRPFPISCSCANGLCRNPDACICKKYGQLCSRDCECDPDDCLCRSYDKKCHGGAETLGCMKGVRQHGKCACAKAGRPCFYGNGNSIYGSNGTGNGRRHETCVYCDCVRGHCGNGNEGCPANCRCGGELFGRGFQRPCQCLRCDERCRCLCPRGKFVPKTIDVTNFLSFSNRNSTYALLIIKSAEKDDYLKFFDNKSRTGDEKALKPHAEEKVFKNLLGHFFAVCRPESQHQAKDSISDITEIILHISRCPCYHHDCKHKNPPTSHQVEFGKRVDRCDSRGSGKKCAKLLADFGKIVKYLGEERKLHPAFQGLVLRFYRDYHGSQTENNEMVKQWLNDKRYEILEESEWNVYRSEAPQFRDLVQSYRSYRSGLDLEIFENEEES